MKGKLLAQEDRNVWKSKLWVSDEVHRLVLLEFKTWQPSSAFAKLSPSVQYTKEHTHKSTHTCAHTE